MQSYFLDDKIILHLILSWPPGVCYRSFTLARMAPSCASHVTRAVVREVVDPDGEDHSQPAWQPALYKLPPFFTDVSILPEWSEEELLAQKVNRDLLASQAQARYEGWLAENPPSKPDIRPQTSTHPNSHRFRDRDREKELAPKHWQNPNRVMHERERIEAVLNSSLYMSHPPYPKQGGGVKNLGFSFMKSSYDYRQRLPSKEVSGTVSMLRTRPRTESERVNKVLQDDALRDTLGGGRWTADNRYGNPPHCLPVNVGSPFRSNSPQRWLRAARGGFERSFPSGTADTQTLFLHHNEPYADHVHPVVAPNVRCGSRSREPEKEMGHSLGESFSSLVPLNTYLPNRSKLCNWNVNPPVQPTTARSLRRMVTTQTTLRAGLG